MNNKVTITGINSNDIKTLPHDECIKLLKEYHMGNMKVKNTIINGNLKLILMVIKKINYGNNIDPDDLFQIGVIGLIKAIENFNTSYNLAFSTYAIPMINGEIRRYLRDNNNVKISRQVKDLAYKILKYKEHYMLDHNDEPTNDMIATYLNVSQFDISEALNSINCVVSLHDPIYQDEGEMLSYIDQISDDSNVKDLIINKETLIQGFKKLDKNQKKVIIDRYYKGLTQEEIASELFISQAQVSRLEKSALKSLKKLF